MNLASELVAGRELDVLVAERVMGWQRCTTEFNQEQFVVVPPDWTDFSIRRWLGHDLNELVPHFSTDIAAAWQVVEFMRSRGYKFHLGDYANVQPPRFQALFERGAFMADGVAWDASAPLAICRAALATTQS